MSDHSDDYDMQINGELDGLVGPHDAPTPDEIKTATDALNSAVPIGERTVGIPTNTALWDSIKQILFEHGTKYESLGSRGGEKELSETADQILKIIQDNQEPLQVNPKSHTYLPNHRGEKTL